MKSVDTDENATDACRFDIKCGEVLSVRPHGAVAGGFIAQRVGPKPRIAVEVFAISRRLVTNAVCAVGSIPATGWTTNQFANADSDAGMLILIPIFLGSIDVTQPIRTYGTAGSFTRARTANVEGHAANSTGRQSSDIEVPEQRRVEPGRWTTRIPLNKHPAPPPSEQSESTEDGPSGSTPGSSTTQAPSSGPGVNRWSQYADHISASASRAPLIVYSVGRASVSVRRPTYQETHKTERHTTRAVPPPGSLPDVV